MSAGWGGVFAVEKNQDAFSSLYHNLTGRMGDRYRFSWPLWLPLEPSTISDLLTLYAEELRNLRGSIDLLAGGPPCQGFSTAGRRNPNDSRNRLAEEYIKVVELVQPQFMLIENVHGFDIAFSDSDVKGTGKKNQYKKKAYSQVVKERLESLGYKVFQRMVNCADFGVPQLRKRFIMLSIKEGHQSLSFLDGRDPLEILVDSSRSFMRAKGLVTDRYVSTREAISDLETSRRNLIPCTDSDVKGFCQLDYEGQASSSGYQKLMRTLMNGSAPNSLRLPRHQQSTVEKFGQIQKLCPLGKCLSRERRASLGICKHSLTPLHPELPSVTVTTLPDDILHYSEPRILTVRENARLQSFPDWFEFQGKYTTGGKERKNQCPRYTQVGNAVPPLLSEAIGILMLRLLNKAQYC